ncbi:dTDP-4-dehydrorhamnose 3,5-epimerase family protein, partial [Yersinia enterocolitica]
MFISTEIEGIYIFEPKIFHDNRGYFYESYNK